MVHFQMHTMSHARAVTCLGMNGTQVDGQWQMSPWWLSRGQGLCVAVEYGFSVLNRMRMALSGGIVGVVEIHGKYKAGVCA